MLLSMHIGSKDRSSFTGPNTSNMTALKQSAAKLSLSVYRGTVSSGDGDDEEENGARARSRWPRVNSSAGNKFNPSLSYMV